MRNLRQNSHLSLSENLLNIKIKTFLFSENYSGIHPRKIRTQ
ncbi:hypothetical protein IFVP177_C2150111 [Vibrio parahaemolyticus]